LRAYQAWKRALASNARAQKLASKSKILARLATDIAEIVRLDLIRYCPRCGLRRGNINDGTLGKAERIKQLNILFAEAGSGEHAWGKEKEEEISIDKSPLSFWIINIMKIRRLS